MDFGPRHYVPILKCKRAEKSALQLVAPAVRAELTPLLEIVELKEGKTLAEHLETALQKLGASLTAGKQFFLDPLEVAGVSIAAAREVFDAAAAESLSFVPVTGVSRSVIETQAAIAHSSRGLCLRLEANELERGDLLTRINAFLTANRLEPAGIDLIMDMGALEEKLPAVVQAIAEEFVDTVPRIRDWRTLTLAGTSFPRSMGVVGTNSHALVDRVEWSVWSALYSRRSRLVRMPSFGDAGIQHPSGVEGFIPGVHQVSAAIRYATGAQWLLVKGSSTRSTPATVQFPRLAQQLVPRGPLSRYFAGARHCDGCDKAVWCAQHARGLGSPEVWRRIGTIHHLKTVVDQLSALPSP